MRFEKQWHSLAVHPESKPSLGDFMMAHRHRFRIMQRILNLFSDKLGQTLRCNDTKLFIILFSVMLTNAFLKCNFDVRNKYRFDSKVYKLRMIQSESKVQKVHLCADDLQQNSKTEIKCKEL